MLTTLIIAVLIGLIPAAIANSKGGSFFGWWLFGAALFIIALPAALLMKPDKAALERKQLSEGMKKCPDCAEMIRADAQVCRFCGYRFAAAAPVRVPAASSTKRFKCFKCEHIQTVPDGAQTFTCEQCGQALKSKTKAG